jgi:transcriptional antiterminator
LLLISLTEKEIAKIVALRNLEEPVTIENLAIRFGVSERTIYYALAYAKGKDGL